MEEDKFVLELIVADHIEDGKYVAHFSYGFLFDFLSRQDQQTMFSHGVSNAYGIVKKRRAGQEGRSDAYFAIPFFIEEGERFVSITCPAVAGYYTDSELHEKLPHSLRGIDERVREAGLKGLVLATERPEADIVERTFEALGYQVNRYERSRI